MAILRHTFNYAFGSIRVSPLQIVHNEEIEQAVVVDIDPCSGNCPERAVVRVVRLVEAGFPGYITEGAIAFVVIERIAVDAGDEDVRMAIVVVVADSDTYIESVAFESGLFRDVGEGAISIVS